MGTSLMGDGVSAVRKAQTLADMVGPATWRDQWGRKYRGLMNNKTRDPVGDLTPHGWKPPHVLLFPPSHLRRFNPNDIGDMTIDIDAWITEVGTGRSDWRKHLSMWARKSYGAAAAEVMDNPPPALLELAGPTPLHEDFLKAMKAGNRWVLGLPNPRTGRLYDTPQWAKAVWETLHRIETFDGSDVDLSVDAARFADEDGDDETDDIVSRLEASGQFADIEEDADSDVAPKFEALPNRRLHRKKVPE